MPPTSRSPSPWACRPSRTWPCRRPDPRRASGRRDVRQRADRRARWASIRCRARGCSTSCSCSACRSSSSTTSCAARRSASSATSRRIDDLPPDDLVDQLIADQHLIMAPTPSAHWPTELYLPSAVFDRDNREAWLRAGARTPTSGLRRGRPAARRVRAARDGPARSTKSCGRSSGGSTGGVAAGPGRAATGRRQRARHRRTPPQPATRGRRTIRRRGQLRALKRRCRRSGAAAEVADRAPHSLTARIGRDIDPSRRLPVDHLLTLISRASTTTMTPS